MSFPTTKHLGYISEYPGNGTHCPAAVQYFEANVPNGVDANGTPLYKIVDVATHVGFYSATNDLTAISEVVLDPGNISIASANVTLNNVSVWSANSILTQGRADGRYVANGTLATVATSGNYSDLIGKPTLATVATSGNYNDLANTPTPYSLPTATNTTLGGIKIGGNLSITNGTLSALVPTYTLPAATNATLGGVIVGSNLTVNNGTISANIPVYTLSAATNATLGGVIVGSGLAIANGVLSSTTTNIDGGSATTTGTGSYDGGSATAN